MKDATRILLGCWLINLLLGLGLAATTVQATLQTAEGSTIRPMALFALMVQMTALGLLVGAVGAGCCIFTAPKRLAVYALALCTLVSGAAPSFVPCVALRVMMEQRSLVLED